MQKKIIVILGLYPREAYWSHFVLHLYWRYKGTWKALSKLNQAPFKSRRKMRLQGVDWHKNMQPVGGRTQPRPCFQRASFPLHSTTLWCLGLWKHIAPNAKYFINIFTSKEQQLSAPDTMFVFLCKAKRTLSHCLINYSTILLCFPGARRWA